MGAELDLLRQKNHKNSKGNDHKKKKRKLQECNFEEKVEQKLNKCDSEGCKDIKKFQYIQSPSDIFKKIKTNKKSRTDEVLQSEVESFEGIKCKHIHKNDSSNEKYILSEESSIEIQSDSNHKKKKQKLHKTRFEEEEAAELNLKKSKNKEKFRCEEDEHLQKLHCIQFPSEISRKTKTKKKNKTDKVMQSEEESFESNKCKHKKKKDCNTPMLLSSGQDKIEIQRNSNHSTGFYEESDNESKHLTQNDQSITVNQKKIKKHSQKDCKPVSCISSPVKEATGRNEMDTLFSSLCGFVSPATMDAINSLGFNTMTEIQAQAILPLLEGKDLRGTAKTGSGKTLAFLIPAVELLHRLQFESCHGTGVLVLSPTRELALQSYGMAQRLLQHHRGLGCALITGGKDREEEARELSNGASLVIATPGRLLDHFQSEVFRCNKLAALVVDEADRMLGTAFEEQVMRILTMLPSQRQTVLFSATATSRSHPLIQRALRDDFVDVDVTRATDAVTCDSLQQAYAVCPTELKFLFLYKFLKKQCRQHKVIVFFSTCDAVQFYTELLNVVCVDVNGIHGKQKQGERTACFRRFNEARTGALLCTDVAARGWDIPGVDWVVQYDPPEDTSEYIHRVGRTARGAAMGRALLLLREEERTYVACVQERCRATLQEMVIQEDRIPTVQEKVEAVVQGSAYIAQCGRLAFKSYIHSYTMHKRKDIFNIYSLDIRKLAKSFGFSTPPRVDLAIEYKKGSEKKLRRRVGEGYYQGEGPEAERKRNEKERENGTI